MQHNCVYGCGYYDRVINHQSIVVFLRKEMSRMLPLNLIMKPLMFCKHTENITKNRSQLVSIYSRARKKIKVREAFATIKLSRN